MFALSRASTSPRSGVVRLYLSLALCFATINVTTDRWLAFLGAHGWLSNNTIGHPDPERTKQFFVVPLKEFIFFIGTSVLLWPLLRAVYSKTRSFLSRADLLQTLFCQVCAISLIATFFPHGMGKLYAEFSIQPFDLATDDFYRRLLLPGLAHTYHLDGAMFTPFFWCVFFLTALMVKAFFHHRGMRLSRWEELSLLTVGSLSAALETPGQPEFLGLLFGLAALLLFEEDQQYTWKQSSAFGLLLMAHEACALLVFLPMALFIFGRKSWRSLLAVISIYGFFMLLNFHFRPLDLIKMQTSVDGVSAETMFMRHRLDVIKSILFTYKLLWIPAIVGFYSLGKQSFKKMAFPVLGVILSILYCVIAVDYTRLIGFSMISILFGILEAREVLSHKLYRVIMIANIAIPSLVCSAGVTLMAPGAYQLYRILLHPLLHAHGS